MSLEVIGAGFGRTGTASLRRALEILGFGPCYHMFEIRRAPWRATAWLRVVRGGAADWEHIFDGYRSAVDWPTCSFYAELAATYPSARVILTQRPPERWYDSTRETIYALSRAFPRWSSGLPVFRHVYALLDGLIWEGTFNGRFEERAHAISTLNAHEANVIDAVPAERLLIFDVSQGWGPLCGFLQVPEPNEPFPHLNERAEIVRTVRWIRAGRALVPLLLLGMSLALWAHLAR